VRVILPADLAEALQEPAQAAAVGPHVFLGSGLLAFLAAAMATLILERDPHTRDLLREHGWRLLRGLTYAELEDVDTGEATAKYRKYTLWGMRLRWLEAAGVVEVRRVDGAVTRYLTEAGRATAASLGG
jgi:hypothetical protein